MSTRNSLIGLFVICISFSLVEGGGTPLPYWPGQGTLENPYQITNITELRAIDNDGGIWCGKVFKLMNDIDFSQTIYSGAVVCPDTDAFTDDFQGVIFSGVFDGNGHVISNLAFNRSAYDDTNDRLSYLGLFGKTSQATIKNLTIENFSFTMSSYSTSNLGIVYSQIGALVGRAYGSTIDNCHAESNIKCWKAYAECSYIGGLCGSVKETAVTNCSSVAKFEINVQVGEVIGGLIGESVDQSTIQNCISQVDMIGGYTIGGIAGSARKTTINKCFSEGMINGVGNTGGLIGDAYMSTVKKSGAKTSVYGRINGNSSGYGTGGLVGYCDADIDPQVPASPDYQTIENCYWQGIVLAYSHAGGIAGVVDTTTSISKCYAAGLCDYPDSLTLPSPSDIPTASSGETMGSFVGSGLSASYDYCYFDKWLCGHIGVGDASTDPISKRDTYAMKKAATFPDWDFDNVWFVIDDKFFPILQWQAAAYKGDTNLDGIVELIDFMTLAENWLDSI